MLHQVSLTSDCAQQSSLSCLIEKKKKKLSASQRQLYENRVFSRFYWHKNSFFPLFAVIYCSAKNSSLYFKVLALNGASSRRTVSHADIEYQRTNDFQVLPALCVKNSTARRAFCQTSTQQLGLSTKGAPLCCWGYR